MTQLYKTTNGLNGLVGNALSFKPTDIANCDLWLEADLGVTLTSGKVSTWADQSGNARNFTQSTAGNRPTYTVTLAGKTVLSGDGSAIRLTSSWTPSGTQYTVYAVARNTRASANQANAIDTIFTCTDGSLNSIRLESFNYFDNTVQRAVIAHSAGTVTPYKNGFYVSGLFSGTYLALNEWAIMTATYDGISGSNAAKILCNLDQSLMSSADVAAVIVYNGIHTQTQRRQVENYLALRWGQQSMGVANRVITCEGDSLTEGYGLDMDGSWPYQLYNNLLAGNNGYRIHNAAVSGSTLIDLDARCSDPNGIDNYDFGDNALRYLVIWCGTNDMYVSGDTPSTTYSRLRTVIQNRKATGKYNYILVGNCIPRGVGTNFSTFNSLLASNLSTLQSDGMDALIDFTTDTAFDAAADSNNTTYYQADTTHLTAAGELKIANKVKAALDTLP